MLKITLYKNCILNENYQQVFSLGKRTGQTISVLEEYLNTLVKQVIELDSVYQENSGTIVIEQELFNSNIYEFNYMKVETIEENTAKILRYCFIQNISLKNDVVYLSYEEDIWSSYANKINGITESYLERCRIKNLDTLPISLYNLPIEYDGNNILLNSIFNTDNDNEKKVLIVQIQIYKTAGQGEITERKNAYYLIGNSRAVTAPFYYFYALQDKIIEIIKNQSIGYVSIFNRMEHDTPIYDYFRYEIGNIYIIPISVFGTPLVGSYIGTLRTSQEQSEENLFGYLYDMPYRTGEIRTFKTYTLNNDFKNKYIGTFKTLIPVINNGYDSTIDIKFCNSMFNFSVYIYFQNGIYDITSDFLYSPPIQAISSEQNALNKMERNLKNISAGFQIASGVIGIGTDIISSIGNGGYSLFGEKAKKQTTRLSKTLKSGNKKIISTSEMIGGKSSLLNSFGENIGNINKIGDGITSLIATNAPLYSTNSGVFGNSSNEINWINGINCFYINPSNSNFVIKEINNTGYIVFEFLNDISKLKLENPSYYISTLYANYNTIKFSTCNVYGAFPRTIALILNEILEQGTRIWFDYQMREDNYVQ